MINVGDFVKYIGLF